MDDASFHTKAPLESVEGSSPTGTSSHSRRLPTADEGVPRPHGASSLRKESGPMRLPRGSAERQVPSASHGRARGPEEACRRLQGFLPSPTATSSWSSPLRTRLVRVATTTLHGRSSSSQAHAWTCAQRGEAERSGIFAARGTTGTAGDGDEGARIALRRMPWSGERFTGRRWETSDRRTLEGTKAQGG